MIMMLFLAGLSVGLLAASIIDARTQRIPDAINAALALLGLGYAALDQRLLDALIGAAVGYIMIWGVNAFYRARRGHDGVGMGDAKLLAAGGAWVGWFGVPFVVLVASSAALVLLAAWRVTGRRIDPTDRIAFGPFIAAGIFAVVVGQRLAVVL